MTVRLERLEGERLRASLDALAELRIKVFRAFPYLYDGTAEYEKDYLAGFASSPMAVVIGAFDAQMLVGAATASPMSDQDEDFQDRVRGAGIDPATLFYFGESVLLPRYRGRGVGHGFFDGRERAARERGAEGAMFAAVVRPDDHPSKPKDYRPLDAFWRSRGYAPVAGLITEISWREIGEASESPKQLQCWMRRW